MYWCICSCCTITCHWEENNQLKTDFILILAYKAEEIEPPLLPCFCFLESINALTRQLTSALPDLPPVLFLISLKAFADTGLCFGTNSSGAHLTLSPSCCRSTASRLVCPVCTCLLKANMEGSEFIHTDRDIDRGCIQVAHSFHKKCIKSGIDDYLGVVLWYCRPATCLVSAGPDGVF